MLSNTYDEAAISERKCHEWFQRFKNVEDWRCNGLQTVYEDAELQKALLDEDSCQTQKELAGSLGVTVQAIKMPQSWE